MFASDWRMSHWVAHRTAYAAKTSHVEECTRDITAFILSSRVVLWDLPGAGTQSHPANTYAEDKALAAFDVLVSGHISEASVVCCYLCILCLPLTAVRLLAVAGHHHVLAPDGGLRGDR
jgi:hypothetical protein